jgi:Tfp pilus assembly protein PilX
MKQLRQQDGAVALITTIIISLLLAIITTALIATMSSELRQQDDNEQSTLAYYAAQSGVEDALGKIKAALPGAVNQPTCTSNINPGLDTNSPGTVGWTCQIITTSGNPTGNIATPDQAVQIDPGASAPNYESVVIEWDSTKGNGAGYFMPPVGASLLNSASWNYAALLEAAIVQYPKTPGFAAADANVQLKNAVMAPAVGVAGVGSYGTLRGNNPILANCDPARTPYHCKVILDIPADATIGGNNFLYRLRTRYIGTSYKMTFYSLTGGRGLVVPVSDGTATIDVTAKANDAFRRVIYKVPFKNGAAIGLDYVIYSDTDICKNFTVLNSAIRINSCP